MLLEIQQDGGRLKDNKIVAIGIDKNGDTAVWIQLDEPGFLLNVGRDIDVGRPAKTSRS